MQYDAFNKMAKLNRTTKKICKLKKLYNPFKNRSPIKQSNLNQLKSSKKSIQLTCDLSEQESKKTKIEPVSFEKPPKCAANSAIDSVEEKNSKPKKEALRKIKRKPIVYIND